MQILCADKTSFCRLGHILRKIYTKSFNSYDFQGRSTHSGQSVYVSVGYTIYGLTLANLVNQLLFSNIFPSEYIRKKGLVHETWLIKGVRA